MTRQQQKPSIDITQLLLLDNPPFLDPNPPPTWPSSSHASDPSFADVFEVRQVFESQGPQDGAQGEERGGLWVGC